MINLKSLRLFILLTIGLSASVGYSLEFSPREYISTMLTRMYFMAKDFEGAKNETLKALRKNPLQAHLHMNLGLAETGLGHANQALGSFQMAEELAGNDPAMLFIARFNAATVLANQKKIDEAIAKYQGALEIDPNSRETKTNIELLMQQQQQQQNGEGEGDGENKDKQEQDSKDGKGEKNQKEPKDFKESKQYKPKFESKSLSEGDVKKILEEIKRQEKQIHGNEEKLEQRQNKDNPNDKDW